MEQKLVVLPHSLIHPLNCIFFNISFHLQPTSLAIYPYLPHSLSLVSGRMDDAAGKFGKRRRITRRKIKEDRWVWEERKYRVLPSGEVHGRS
ncbi:uncharacterized protein G2W53_038114 [Senna tora]|uniref:Uncharacterized protein n=1 Tax=Senna tora TaxID=362788 RepID=A0A834W1T4_9FABA|nr:uncharacterized protein G2W53_038114 [Senna tora]